MSQTRPFHLAIPVHDIEIAKAFYVEHFNCQVGRSDKNWVDLNLYGHQLVLHFDSAAKSHEDNITSQPSLTNAVDGHKVPVPHFGVILSMEDWKTLSEELQKKGVSFGIKPYIRFEGEIGEQATMFLYDPSGNALEFKAFAHDHMIFEAA